MNAEFTDIGKQSPKSIARPVRAYGVVLDGSSTMAASELQLPSKPSTAVLSYMTGDPKEKYFGVGIAEDIITMLSRSHSLFVIARTSSFTYKGRSVDVKQKCRSVIHVDFAMARQSPLSLR